MCCGGHNARPVYVMITLRRIEMSSILSTENSARSLTSQADFWGNRWRSWSVGDGYMLPPDKS